MGKSEQGYNILVVDDHDVVCIGFSSLLAERNDIVRVDSALDYKSMMHHLEKTAYHILILDLNLGGHNTFSDIRVLVQKYPDMKILVCSMYAEDIYAVQCIQEGASGYLHKRKAKKELFFALETIMNGDIYLSAEYRQCLNYGIHFSKSDIPSLSTLTQREFEICQLIASGMEFKKIAQKLGISSKTVSAHHANILAKLSLSNTFQLIHFVLQHETVSKPS